MPIFISFKKLEHLGFLIVFSSFSKKNFRLITQITAGVILERHPFTTKLWYINIRQHEVRQDSHFKDYAYVLQCTSQCTYSGPLKTFANAANFFVIFDSTGFVRSSRTNPNLNAYFFYKRHFKKIAVVFTWCDKYGKRVCLTPLKKHICFMWK